MRLVATLLLAALLIVPASLAREATTYRYVGGFAGLQAAFASYDVCAGSARAGDEDLTPVVGGACVVPATPGETLSIQVVDDVRGADVGYAVRFLAIHGTNLVGASFCAPDAVAHGATTVVVPDGCTHVSVLPYAPATAGDVTIA